MCLWRPGFNLGCSSQVLSTSLLEMGSLPGWNSLIWWIGCQQAPETGLALPSLWRLLNMVCSSIYGMSKTDLQVSLSGHLEGLNLDLMCLCKHLYNPLAHASLFHAVLRIKLRSSCFGGTLFSQWVLSRPCWNHILLARSQRRNTDIWPSDGDTLMSRDTCWQIQDLSLTCQWSTCVPSTFSEHSKPWLGS